VKLNLKFFASLQFWLGLILAAAAVVAFIVLGQAVNPTPLRVIVAREDIQRGDVITEDVLVVSKQQIDPSLASYYVQEKDLPTALGAVAVDSIYKGDPIAKLRLAVGQDVERAKRLSSALEDPAKVIRVIPVGPDNCPELVFPGDVVEVGLSLTGQPPSQIGARPAAGPAAVRAYNAPISEEEGGETFDLPASKVILRDLLVLRVEHEKVPNPNYGAGMGTDAASQPAFLEGDVERLVVLVGERDTELLDFALYNGKVSIGLRSYLVRDEMEAGVAQPPTMGVTWTDFDRWFVSQRISATLHLSETLQGPAGAALSAGPDDESVEAEGDRPQVVMARHLDQGNQPIEPTETFVPGDAFCFSVPLAVAQGSTVTVRWYYGDDVIHEEPYAADSDDAAVVWGRLASEDAWPEGSYRVVISDPSGQELASVAFQVREG
jgi:Flp pilus assembly protein CpaB